MEHLSSWELSRGAHCTAADVILAHQVPCSVLLNPDNGPLMEVLLTSSFL